MRICAPYVLAHVRMSTHARDCHVLCLSCRKRAHMHCATDRCTRARTHAYTTRAAHRLGVGSMILKCTQHGCTDSHACNPRRCPALPLNLAPTPASCTCLAQIWRSLAICHPWTTCQTTDIKHSGNAQDLHALIHQPQPVTRHPTPSTPSKLPLKLHDA